MLLVHTQVHKNFSTYLILKPKLQILIRIYLQWSVKNFQPVLQIAKAKFFHHFWENFENDYFLYVDLNGWVFLVLNRKCRQILHCQFHLCLEILGPEIFFTNLIRKIMTLKRARWIIIPHLKLDSARIDYEKNWLNSK